MQKLVYARTVRIEAAAVTFVVGFIGALADEVDHIKAKTLHTLVHPESYNIAAGLTHAGVLPV